MEIVRAALGHDVYDSAGHLAKFRLIAVRLDLELLNIVDDGLVVIGTAVRAKIVEPIKIEHIAAVALPVYRGEGESSRRFGAPCPSCSVLCNCDSAHAGCQRQHLGKIAAIQR